MLFAQLLQQPKGWDLGSTLPSRWKRAMAFQNAQFMFPCKLPPGLKHLSRSIPAGAQSERLPLRHHASRVPSGAALSPSPRSTRRFVQAEGKVRRDSAVTQNAAQPFQCFCSPSRVSGFAWLAVDADAIVYLDGRLSTEELLCCKSLWLPGLACRADDVSPPGPRPGLQSAAGSARRFASLGPRKRLLKPWVFLGKGLSCACFSNALEMLN